MIQELKATNNTDPATGAPAGGYANAVGLTIEWQNGPLMQDGQRSVPNGCFVETVIAAALQRIEYYQDSPFACQENADAIECLRHALERLNARTERRVAAGTEGTHRGN